MRTTETCTVCQGSGVTTAWGPSSCTKPPSMCCGGCEGPEIPCPYCSAGFEHLLDLEVDMQVLKPKPVTLAELVVRGLCPVCCLPDMAGGVLLDHDDCCPF